MKKNNVTFASDLNKQEGSEPKDPNFGLIFFSKGLEQINEAPLYRGDTRTPSLIFREGFKAWGDNLDLHNHIYYGNYLKDSAYVSTTFNQKSALWFPKHNYKEQSFLYEINPQTTTVNMEAYLVKAVLNGEVDKFDFLPFLSEHERAIPSKIEAHDIRGAWQVERQKNLSFKIIKGSYIANPNYKGSVEIVSPKLVLAGKVLGHSVLGVGILLDGISLMEAYNTSVRDNDYQPLFCEGARIAGAWSGAISLGFAFAKAGAAVCSPLAPYGPPVCSFLAGAVGSVIGYQKGSEIASCTKGKISIHLNDNIFSFKKAYSSQIPASLMSEQKPNRCPSTNSTEKLPKAIPMKKNTYTPPVISNEAVERMLQAFGLEHLRFENQVLAEISPIAEKLELLLAHTQHEQQLKQTSAEYTGMRDGFSFIGEVGLRYKIPELQNIGKLGAAAVNIFASIGQINGCFGFSALQGWALVSPYTAIGMAAFSVFDTLFASDDSPSGTEIICQQLQSMLQIIMDCFQQCFSNQQKIYEAIMNLQRFSINELQVPLFYKLEAIQNDLHYLIAFFKNTHHGKLLSKLEDCLLYLNHLIKNNVGTQACLSNGQKEQQYLAKLGVLEEWLFRFIYEKSFTGHLELSIQQSQKQVVQFLKEAGKEEYLNALMYLYTIFNHSLGTNPIKLNTNEREKLLCNPKMWMLVTREYVKHLNSSPYMTKINVKPVLDEARKSGQLILDFVKQLKIRHPILLEEYKNRYLLAKHQLLQLIENKKIRIAKKQDNLAKEEQSLAAHMSVSEADKVHMQELSYNLDYYFLLIDALTVLTGIQPGLDSDFQPADKLLATVENWAFLKKSMDEELAQGSKELNKEKVARALKYGANVNTYMNGPNSPTHHRDYGAPALNAPAIIQALVAYKACREDRSKEQALFAVLKEILSYNPDLGLKNSRHWCFRSLPALAFAADSSEATILLLIAGAEPNQSVDVYKESSYHCGVNSEYVSTHNNLANNFAQELAKISNKWREAWQLYQHFIQNNSQFAQKAIDLPPINNNKEVGTCLLWISALLGESKILHALNIDNNNADFSTGLKSITPLTIAAKLNHAAVFEFLLLHNANQPAINGCSPFEIACHYFSRDVINVMKKRQCIPQHILDRVCILAGTHYPNGLIDFIKQPLPKEIKKEKDSPSRLVNSVELVFTALDMSELCLQQALLLKKPVQQQQHDEDQQEDFQKFFTRARASYKEAKEAFKQGNIDKSILFFSEAKANYKKAQSLNGDFLEINVKLEKINTKWKM